MVSPDRREPWNGYWGSDPPYHHPVFVLTRYPRESLELDGGTTFHFVTDDEMLISVVPVLLGGGARLFDNLAEPRPTLRQTEAVEAPGVTHIRYTRIEEG